jgi:hypothetical protein
VCSFRRLALSGWPRKPALLGWENAELLKKVAELEARVPELEPVVEETEESEQEAA